MSSLQRSEDGQPTADEPFPEIVDWLLGALIALGGMLPLIAGTAMLFFVDREVLAEGIEDEVVTVTIGTRELTSQEQLDVADAVVSWLSVGMVLTGVGMVLFGLLYIYVRRRSRSRRARGDPTSSFLPTAVLGGVATALLSFVPFSPALGGAIAGYLEANHSRQTVGVGAVAGFLPFLPVLSIMLFFIGGLVSGLISIGDAGAGVVAGLAIFFGLMVTVTIGAVLGALGGYLGGRLFDRRATQQTTTPDSEGPEQDTADPADAFQAGSEPAETEKSNESRDAASSGYDAETRDEASSSHDGEAHDRE